VKTRRVHVARQTAPAAKKKEQPGATRVAATPGAKKTPAAGGTNFLFVGLGASAGGLEALEEFFLHTPPASGMAFVVMTHQHPGHVSLLPELLKKHTRMSVIAARDGLRVAPNCVYVATAEGYLGVFDGTLHLMPFKDSGGARLPIDYFFRSLAEDQKERAVGIVLSGTGTDGTLGLKAIKGATGMVMAEDPASAKYSGMPQSAIATGLVDYVLPPGQLAAQLIAYAQGPYVAPIEPGPAADGALPEPMQKILIHLRSRTGQDFSVYKPSTIRRRIERRMNVHQLHGPQQYIQFLQENPHEFDLLFKELLIGVTSFFRDPEAFDFLAKTALPELLKARREDSPVRLWVPGCATGEEAYSLAMVLQECLDRLKLRLHVQIFATDLDTEAIEIARGGQYPDGIAGDVSQERLKRFFVKEDATYRVRKEIRELVIFAPQNLLKDPPFTKQDLISCRNLLIYLKADAQKQLFGLFHYALKPEGLLFLGPSENITEPANHFEVRNKKWKLFGRKNSAVTYFPPLQSGHTRLVPVAGGETTGAPAGARARESQLPALLEKVLMKRFVPACVVINERGDIHFIQGRTGDYLEPAAGQPRLNILEMAREGLRAELTAALRRAVAQEEEIIHERVRVRTNGNLILVTITVSRITEPETLRGLLLVTFRPSPGLPAPSKKQRGALTKKEAGRLKDLERDLQFTRESLQSTVEELEAANEELKSTNEELQSTNEELQSANEELETSKEEMQSLNEELQTVNAQLQGKVDDLSEASDDMQNLLNSTAVATIFLDADLKIKRFTEESRKLINLIPTDAGRSIGDLASNLDYTQLVADARDVLRTLVFKEKEIQTKDGSWRMMRISPYRTTENVIDGLVITFVDINATKQAEQVAQAARVYAENIVDTVREPLLILDRELRVVSANQSFYQFFRTEPAQVVHNKFCELGGGQWKIPALREQLDGLLAKRTVVKDFVVEHEFPVIGRKTLVLNARRLQQEVRLPGMILLAMEDATGVKKECG
jgi:two-component system, chemotaxis family, CheB/CheR fusion protein